MILWILGMGGMEGKKEKKTEPVAGTHWTVLMGNPRIFKSLHF